jgi:carbamate kinase
MRLVIALGGNALLECGEKPDADIQEVHVVRAVRTLAPLARQHQLVITHGNGPQVGVLALESARDPALSRPYPFDVLGAQTQGMIGYWLVQALGSALPGNRACCLLCRTVVRADDPAFTSPSKFVGPVYEEARARRLAAERGWDIRQDGRSWRRVVPSPEPVELVELDAPGALRRAQHPGPVRPNAPRAPPAPVMVVPWAARTTAPSSAICGPCSTSTADSPGSATTSTWWKRPEMERSGSCASNSPRLP